jgi:cysteinyl-tRNA synthetase
MKIYNTLTGKKEELKEKKIGIYACGPTVYDDPHIGHARSAYIFDVIVKYLRKTRKIKFVKNVTDIDDKIIERAKKEPGTEELITKAKKVAEKYLKKYEQDMDTLSIAKPDLEPKATETIKDMISFIKKLIKKGYAYEASGNVYFEVRKFKDYGRLSRQSLDDMQEGARVSLDKNKKDPLDFALWKTSKEGEPFWKSPWGNGRPGWHIECSAMSTKFLGKNFLIHGGGLDLVFPHHENEIAQTVASGGKSAKYWIHHGLLTINGQKMSKSLGNFITIKDFIDKFRDIDVLKLFFLCSHYRHPVDYTENKISSMKSMKETILIFLQKVDTVLIRMPIKSVEPIKNFRKLFSEAMDDDFNTPLALSVIFRCIESGNKILEKDSLSKDELKKISSYSLFIREALQDYFGISLEYKATVDNDVIEKIFEREEARKNKDFNKADEIRKELTERGIILEDTKDGTVWRRAY